MDGADMDRGDRDDMTMSYYMLIDINRIGSMAIAWYAVSVPQNIGLCSSMRNLQH